MRSIPSRPWSPAGQARRCLINQNVFHGNYPNIGGYAREMLGLAYRPSWAGPSGQVKQWDPEQVAKVPPVVRELMGRSQHPHLALRGREQAPQHGQARGPASMPAAGSGPAERLPTTAKA